MSRFVWVLALVLSAAPGFAQADPEELLRELGMGGTFALGNLAVRDIQRGNDPVQQFKRFFAQAKLPLSSSQEKQMKSIVDAQVKALVANGEIMRKATAESMRNTREK